MTKNTRRLLVGVLALAGIGAAVAVGVLVSGGDTVRSTAGARPTASDAAGVSEQPETGLAVSTPEAPPAQSVEPRPGDDVATDPAVVVGDSGEVQVALTSAGQVGDVVEIDGFVQGVVEDGGTCTATLTRSGTTDVTASSPSFADATTTLCEPIEIAAEDLVSGSWTVALSYRSAEHAGSSGTTTVQVNR